MVEGEEAVIIDHGEAARARKVNGGASVMGIVLLLFVLVRCRAMLIMFCGGLCFVLMTITIVDNPASSLSGYCSIQQRN